MLLHRFEHLPGIVRSNKLQDLNGANHTEGIPLRYEEGWLETIDQPSESNFLLGA